MRVGVAALLIAGASLTGCVAPVREAPVANPGPPPLRPYSAAGLEAVLGSTANGLVSQFGPADLDVREGPGRKLQFIGPACVLDAYLYPPRPGRGEPIVTHVDARLPDGREMDRSSCVAALSRRREAQ